MSVPATFLLLVLLLAAGKVIARQTGGAAASGADVLNRLGISLLFPAAIVLHAPSLSPSRDLAGLVAVPWLVLLVAVVAGAVAVRGGVDKGVVAVVVCGVGFGNTAFLGYSVVPVLVDDGGSGAALADAVVYDQLGSFVALSTVGLVVIAAAAGRARPTVVEVLKKVVTFPPFIALVAGVTVVPRALPADLERALQVLAGALLPCMAVAVGLRLRFVVPAHHRLPLLLVVIAKLVVVPAVAVAVAAVAGLDEVAADVAVVQAGMPVMVTVGALLALAGVEAELAAAVVAWSTVGSLVTLPLWGLVVAQGSVR